MRKKRKTKPDRGPKIIEYVNEITGTTKWRVWKAGSYYAGVGIPPFSRDFETKAEAIQCYADNFGWTKVEEFVPGEAQVLGVPGDRAHG